MEKELECYKNLKCHVDKFINQSAYSHVDLGQLFMGLFQLK